MKTISGIEFASEHNGTDVFRLIELAYEQGQKDGYSEQLGTNLAEVGTDLVNKRVIDVEGLDEQIRCEMCVNPMHTDRGCDGNCRYDENLYKRIMQTLDERIKPLPSAQPEIIRCKDCKHWIPYDWMFSEVWRSKNMADYPEDEIGCNWCDMAMKANDFCSQAVRRTE